MEGGMITFDAIVIGVGQTGPFLARRLAAAGMSVAVVERGLIDVDTRKTGKRLRSGAAYATTTEYVWSGDTLVSTIDQQFASGVATGPR